MTQVAVVCQEEKLAALRGDDPRSLLAAAVEARGWPRARWYPTDASDGGAGAARAALAEGADLVLACGGDGTVNACASVLAGGGVPMAVLPAGTGNIIAANLGIPAEAAEAIRVALGGSERVVDVGRTGGGVMVAFAGAGLDAAMVQDAPTWLKRRVGWLSYAVSLARHLPDRGFGIVVDVDGRRTRHWGVRTVVVGNMSSLQGGLVLFPDAQPDSGLLEVVVIAPRTLPAWLAVVVDLFAGLGTTGDSVRRFRGRHIKVTARRPVRRESDGEALPDGTVLDVVADPGALRIRVDDAGGAEAAAEAAEAA